MGRQILEKEYTVEKIIDWKIVPKTRKKEYLVKWKGIIVYIYYLIMLYNFVL